MGHMLGVHPHAKAVRLVRMRKLECIILGVRLGLVIYDEEPQLRQMRLAHSLTMSQRCTGISFIRSGLAGLRHSR